MSVLTSPPPASTTDPGAASPPATQPSTSSDSCPLCGAPLHRSQEWCLRCGAAARTRLAAAPNWRAPIAALVVIGALSLGIIAAALVKLAGDSGPAPPPLTTTITRPAAAAPPASTPTTSVPGAVAPGAGTTSAPTSTGAAGATTAPGATGASPAPTPVAPSTNGVNPALQKRLKELKQNLSGAGSVGPKG